MALDSKVPAGPLADKWTTHKGEIPLVSPANKRLLDIIVVGTGLAGSSAAASLAEMGYNVKAFCFQDSPRRAPLLHRVELTQRRIIKTMGIPYIACFTIPLKGVITVQEKEMFTVWLR
jgi:hypothetical protein